MLDWTPPLNEHLFTLNGLWMYTRLCHTNAPPLNRHPQPWTLNFFLNTLLKISLCIASQNCMTSSSQNNAPFALHHGMWRGGTIKTTDTSNSPCARVFRMCMCVCTCAHAHFDWTLTGKGNTLWRPWDKGWCIARLIQWHGFESYGEIKECDISQVLAKEAIKDDCSSFLPCFLLVNRNNCHKHLVAMTSSLGVARLMWSLF